MLLNLTLGQTQCPSVVWIELFSLIVARTNRIVCLDAFVSQRTPVFVQCQ